MEWVPISFLIFKGTVLFVGMFFAIKWHYDQDRRERRKAGGPQSPTEMRLFATMIIALGMSLIGVVYAGCWGEAGEGGRGGALGFAFTFFMLLMPKPAAGAGLTAGIEQADAAQIDGQADAEPETLGEGLAQLAKLKLQIEQLRAAIGIRLASVEREKLYLSVASIFSALAWKFGDIVAAALKF